MGSSEQTRTVDETAAIDALYKAAMTPGRWGETLGVIRKCMTAHSMAVIGFDSGKHVTVALADSAVPGFDRQLKERLVSTYPMFESLSRGRNDLFQRDLSLSRDTESSEEEYFRWLHRHKLTYLLGVVLKDDDCGSLLANFYWTRDAHPARQGLISRLRTIRLHMERSFQISRRMEQRKAYREAIWDLIERSPHGVLAVDTTMKVVHANDEAHRILNERDGVEMRSRKLVASERGVNARLFTLIERTTASTRATTCTGRQSLVIKRPSNRLPVILMVLPAGLAGTEVACGAPMVFLFLRDLARELDTSIATFSMAFALTPAERHLVQSLASGLTLGEHSNAHGVSEETARWHLKNVFVKTHCRSQMQLLNLVRKSSMPRLER